MSATESLPPGSAVACKKEEEEVAAAHPAIPQLCRKRSHADTKIKVEPVPKRARAEDDTATLLDTLGADPERTCELIDGINDRAAEAIERAIHARTHKIERAAQKRREKLSPFNTKCTAHTVFYSIILAHIIPRLNTRGACALRQQSRALRDAIDKVRRVKRRQLTFTLATPSLCHMAWDMYGRFIKDATKTSDATDIVIQSAISTANTNTSADIIADVLSRVTAETATMSRYDTLRHCSTHYAGTIYAGQITFGSVTQPKKDDNSDNVLVARGVHLFSAVRERQTDMISRLIENIRHGTTRISPRLMRTLLGDCILDKYEVCRRADDFASALIHAMARQEHARRPIDQDIDTLEFLLGFLDDCGVRNTSLESATRAATSCKVTAPLLDILRVPVVTKSHAAGPLTLAAKQNNAAALRHLSRRALAEGMSNKAQSRVIMLVAREGYFDCLRVLCEEFFIVAPLKLVTLMINARLPWATATNKRAAAFDAILADVGMCIARGALSTMITQLDTAMELYIYFTEHGLYAGNLHKIEASEWCSTIAGDFLSALWRATSDDARLRSAVVSMKAFREIVDRALIAHLACKFLPAVHHCSTTGYVDDNNVSSAMMALLSRIAELFDMQRCADRFIDLDDGVVTARAPAPTTSMRGVVLDRWLRKLFVHVSTMGMCYIDAAEAATSEIGCIFATDVVHTDIAFQDMMWPSPTDNTHTVSPKWLRDLLFKACASNGVITRTALARRLIRWCGIVAAATSKRSNVAMQRMLDNISNDIIDADADGVVHLTNIPVHAWDNSDNPACLSDTISLLSRFIVHTCGQELGGVEILYATYQGNYDTALRDLTSKLTKGEYVPQPQGVVRDIVVYMMSSVQSVRMFTDQDFINETVKTYTRSVTLPSSWSVFGDHGGVSSTRNTARWLRDLLRGRKEHTMWW